MGDQSSPGVLGDIGTQTSSARLRELVGHHVSDRYSMPARPVST